MRTIDKQHRQNRPARAGERGAALITMLLVSTLILAAGGALIMSTATTATNTIDSTTGKQAFYAAESGLQMALNAMRGNTAPSAAVTAGTKMSLRTAITPSLSNGSADTVPCGTGDGDATVANPRCSLSGWLPYQGTVIPVDPNVAGSAFRLAVFDPENSHMVAFTTEGAFETTGLAGLPGVAGVAVSADKRTLSLIVGTTVITITYQPRTSTAATNAYPSAAADFGSFSIVKSDNLPLALPIGAFARFRLTVNQILPWQASPVTFKSTVATISNCPTQMISFLFDKNSVTASGTTYAASGLISKVLYLPCALTAAQTQIMPATVTAPEPRRVVVRSVGFGPKFSQKHLEMLVTRATLDFEAPATLTLRGADDCTAPTFATGNSNAKKYSGDDRVVGGSAPRPAFAISGCDYQDIVDGTGKPGTVGGSNQVGILNNGAPVPAATPTLVLSYEGVDTPSYLETADKARAFLNEMQSEALGQGRYFKPASGTAMNISSSNAGTAADPKFTFVDGDVNLDGGDGMLIVTGSVNITGNTSYNGIIMVMGKGEITRNGGGNGNLLGAFVIASFKRTWPASENGMAHPFTAPIFDTSGGGASDIQFDSNAVQRALGAMGYVCGGVLEQ
ncbi:MAG TPA: hypothetical protein VM864_13080 [Pyrinomonadaceae bacterium]|jgi:hypothetical protein|nr:hypothetical protein [Pyrinomonadaceae bacterium]